MEVPTPLLATALFVLPCLDTNVRSLSYELTSLPCQYERAYLPQYNRLSIHPFLVDIVDMSLYHNMLASVGSVAPRMAHQENRRDG
jgi:hypothetical protein